MTNRPIRHRQAGSPRPAGLPRPTGLPVIDLTDPDRQSIFNMSVTEARSRVAAGDLPGVRAIEGNFAVVAQADTAVMRTGQPAYPGQPACLDQPACRRPTVRLARSLSVPMRYFIAKQAEGPALVVAHRIADIRQWLAENAMLDQFHPSYTRMVPAHHITEIALVGCPDPNPRYERYFSPKLGTLPPDLDVIARAYVDALADVTGKWLRRVPSDAAIGVCFSGGVDSGAVFLVTYHVMLALGMNPGRLKAFTLCLDGAGEDLAQAREFLETVQLGLFLEPIDVSSDSINADEVIRIVEDYKPLDVQAAAMNLALCRGIRRRYPSWRYLIDGDGGDENLKDYPIEENPELTIRSVLNNSMLYQEGWGVDSIKHSLVYSGGLSRGCTRTFATTAATGFEGFSPFSQPSVIEVAEGIPFVELTGWDQERLYRLKGEIVSRGVRALTGLDMPVFAKRRFQHGATGPDRLADIFPASPQAYRGMFQAAFDGELVDA